MAYSSLLPGKEVREKLLPHISAPALGEAKDVIFVDHQGQEWNMLLVRQNEEVYFLKGHWYDYADVYNLAVSDTIVIERIMKQQVKEDLVLAAVSEIGNHNWDTIFPPNSTWQIEQVNNTNTEDVEKPDELAEQTEIKDIGKVELVVVMYEITIKGDPENTNGNTEVDHMLERLCKKYTNVDSLAFLTESNADIATLEDLGTPQIGNAKSVEANSVQEPSSITEVPVTALDLCIWDPGIGFVFMALTECGIPIPRQPGCVNSNWSKGFSVVDNCNVLTCPLIVYSLVFVEYYAMWEVKV
ncbi:hypothetical protein KY290_036942 [Solanum tuberosum]|uniref:TF-B3 domain-containing protein n=1 Tax=Solanum tuberosum TaxID=4113 RepID=A0ABQ7TU39_SOLTU|nr:hypothetical protein KY290_036942 [Solanum tuberosum]